MAPAIPAPDIEGFPKFIYPKCANFYSINAVSTLSLSGILPVRVNFGYVILIGRGEKGDKRDDHFHMIILTTMAENKILV
jgi:hypothetical protein